MPRTRKTRASDAALPVIPSELIDQIVKGPMSADAVNAASKAFKKALIERCLGAELSHHLGYGPSAEKPEEASNHRNGSSAKTVREIQGLFTEQYGTEVSAEFISSVTDAVMAEVTAWQSRPLERMYPVVFFDALRVKIRAGAVAPNKEICLALGALPDGTRDILGI